MVFIKLRSCSPCSFFYSFSSTFFSVGRFSTVQRFCSPRREEDQRGWTLTIVSNIAKKGLAEDANDAKGAGSTLLISEWPSRARPRP